jgi:glycosyltransferase involved in cell wall biosynthesis
MKRRCDLRKGCRGSRIGIVSPLFSDPVKHGGITPVVLNLARGIADRDVGVDLLVRKPDPEVPTPVQLPENISVIPVPVRHRLPTAFFLASYLKNNAPAALLAAGHRFNLAAAWASRLAPDSRVFLSVHNTMSREAAQRGSVHHLKRMWSIGTFYPWADGIVAVSRGVADDLLGNTRITEAGIEVIHNPIVTPDLLERSREPVDHPWLVPGEPSVILGAGRLSNQKAFHILIEALAHVRRERECRLIILGEGTERERLAGLVTQMDLEDAVDMPGFVSNPQSWMARASVFVLSSLYEGFGNVLVEAMAVGTPVVSTDCPSGPSEILGGGRYGRLVPPGDPVALAGAILETLSESEHPAGSGDAVKPYMADIVADQYLQYMRVLKDD